MPANFILKEVLVLLLHHLNEDKETSGLSYVEEKRDEVTVEIALQYTHEFREHILSICE